MAGDQPIQQALAMLEAFGSVGANAFDVTLLDLQGQKVGFKPHVSLAEIRQSIGARLAAVTQAKHNLIIRPRSTTAALIQLDDLDETKAERVKPFSFLQLCTSPGNFQSWLAVSDPPQGREEAREFGRRLRKGSGADQTATGATRIAGSLNHKDKYSPNFPRVTITYSAKSHLTTVAQLQTAGLIAEPPAQQPPASVPRIRPPQHTDGPRHWPDYGQALRGAPMKREGGPDRSLADYTWCRWALQRGWSVEATAEKLVEVSEKAQERVRLKEDAGYPILTARNAAKSVERDKSARQALKSPAGRRP